MALLFQYGSNCDITRLNAPQRLRGAAINPRLAQTVGEYDIAFNVWSNGNACAASNLKATEARHAWGVLYDIPNDRLTGRGPADTKTMEQIEGQRYEAKQITVRTLDGQEVRATTFLVKQQGEAGGLWTSREYVKHIVDGLRANDAPEEYVQHVIDVAIATNERATQKAEEQNRDIATLR